MIDQQMLRQCFPFPTPREGQIEIITDILSNFNHHKYIILDAPTGVGKSAIAITIARYFQLKYLQTSFVLTTEKVLQKQYSTDFAYQSDIALMFGKNNYVCNIENCPYEEAACHLTGTLISDECFNCYYKTARKTAKKTPTVITNYHYLLIDDFLPEKVKFAPRSLIVMDEAHNMESILLDYSNVMFTKSQIDRLKKQVSKVGDILKLDLSFYYAEIFKLFNKMINQDDNNLDFFITSCHAIRNTYGLLVDDVETQLVSFASEINFYQMKILKAEKLTEVEKVRLNDLKYCVNFKEYIKKLNSKIINMLDNLNNSQWVVDISNDQNTVELKPIFANYLFDNTFNKIASKFLFMSATPHSKNIFSRTFNIDVKEIKEIHLPSKFPIENRTVFNMNLYDLSYRHIDRNLPSVLRTIDDILEKSKCKVLVHTVNYKIAKYVSENSKHKNRIFTHNTENRQKIIERFKNTKNAILISPSLMEGLSLNDEHCRVQIIVKVPYLSLGDKRTKIRKDLDSEWYAQAAIHKIVQASGRGVRHEDDFCLTYVLDTSFNRMLKMNYSLFPKWFLEAVQANDQTYSINEDDFIEIEN